MHTNVLHAQTALHALADALGMVDEAIRDEAITRVRVGPPSAAPRRGPRSIARLSALIHSERCDRVTNARAGIHQIGSTCAPVRAELLDLARRAPGLVDEVATDAAWIVASSPCRCAVGRCSSTATPGGSPDGSVSNYRPSRTCG